MGIDLEYFEVEINGRIHPVPKYEFSPYEKSLGKEGYRIMIWDSNIDAAKQVIIEQGIKHIKASTSDLNFLYDPIFNELEGVYIFGQMNDLLPLERINSLKYLDLRCDKKGKIDFKAFPNLRHLNCEYSKKYKNLASLSKLESLMLTGYSGATLEEFVNFHELTELHLNFANCESLSGLHSLPKLQKLTLDECKKLVTLNGIGDNKSLSELVISGCRNLKDFSAIDKLNPNCEVILNAKNFNSSQVTTEESIEELVNALQEIGCEEQLISEIKIVIEALKNNVNDNDDWKAVLKICILKLNKISDQYDAIYTEEREEIISAIQHILVDYSTTEVEKLIDKYRNW